MLSTQFKKFIDAYFLNNVRTVNIEDLKNYLAAMYVSLFVPYLTSVRYVFS